MPMDDLYREVILDHYKRPRNRGQLDPHSARAEGNNPLCGDEIQVDLCLEGQAIENVAFKGSGCSISQASASMMTEAVKEGSVRQAEELIAAFKRLMHGDEVDRDLLGDLESLEGVQKFPVRIKCALLPWTTLEEALQQIPR